MDLRPPHAREVLEEVVLRTIAEATDDPWRPAQPRGGYSRHTAGSRSEALALLEQVDVSDQLLLAGLSRLLSAQRLMSDGHHAEEAALALFTSMGAAMDFLRQALPNDGAGELSYSDVYEYLRATFPHGDHVVDYFEEMYNLRVIAMHPSSRFGDYWNVPMMRCDLYDLPKSLMALYRHIITGETPAG